MSMKKVLGLTVALLLLSGMTGIGTWAYFSDTETSAGNQMAAGTLDLKTDDVDGVSQTLFVTNLEPGSTYSAEHTSGDTYLTTDDLDTYAAENITVAFWFKIKLLNKGPLNIQIYNGTAYNTWFNLTAYPGIVKNTWMQFSETITDSQYFISNFRIRFDGSGLTTDAFIDDVLIEMNQ